MANKSITVMVPAYNEEGYLDGTIETIQGALKGIFEDYEILIFDDCSTDKTGFIADEIAKKSKYVTVIHNKKNQGLGYNHRIGAQMSSKDYYCWVPGDNDFSGESIRSLLSNIGDEDILLSYPTNREVRPLYRRVISASFTKTLNFLFGLNLNWYTGVIVYRTALLKDIRRETNSFAYNAEILVQLLKKGCTYREFPVQIKGVRGSNMFKIKNIVGILTTVVKLYFRT